MLPYLQLQALYLAATGAFVLAAWHGAGRVLGERATPRRRFLACFLLIGSGGLVGGVLFAGLGALAGKFAAVAVGYYAAAFWLPALGFASLVRGPRDLPLALACTALVAGGLYALLVEPNRLRLSEHELVFDAWPADAPPLRVVHVSDLQTVGRCEREARAAAWINSLEPDLIVWTGDYVAGPFGNVEPAVAAARAFLGSLRARYGIVVLSGHSEPERVRRRVFEGFDVRYLNDEALDLELSGGRRLHLFGMRTRDYDLDRLAPPDDPAAVVVVASHVPDVSSELDGRGVDLHLAGHTHGGQIAFPFVGPPVTLSRLSNRYARGLHRFGDHWLNVTPGIGMEGHHAPRIRFLCPPEIDLLVLRGGGPPAPPPPERP